MVTDQIEIKPEEYKGCYNCDGYYDEELCYSCDQKNHTNWKESTYSVTQCDGCKLIFDTTKIKKCPVCHKPLKIIKDSIKNLKKSGCEIKYPVEVCNSCIIIWTGYLEKCKHCGKKLDVTWETEDRVIAIKAAQEDAESEYYE